MSTSGDAGHVVVGYDGSGPAAAAVAWAAAEAAQRGQGLVVLHVADHVMVLPGGLPRQVTAGEAAALGVAAEGAERARRTAPGLAVTTRTHVARVAPTLVAASIGADLVVVGSRGRGELTAALLGSVAFAVTADAHCPVVVVRDAGEARPGPGHPVVVGVDAWPDEEDAVHFAARSAAATGAPLVVVVASPAAAGGSGDPDRGPLEAEGAVQFERLTRQVAHEVAEAAAVAARRECAGLEVGTRVVAGPAARALVDATRGCALLVIGSHAGGFGGLRLGSVSHAVLHDAACPVAVVPDLVSDPLARR